MTTLAIYCAVVGVLTLLPESFTASTRPKYVGCLDTTECAVGTCCMLGMGRFSIPQCKAHGELGEPCRRNSQAIHNATLFYPDGQTVVVTNVYHVLCQCAQGLYCSDTGTCEDPLENVKFNEIDVNF